MQKSRDIHLLNWLQLCISACVTVKTDIKRIREELEKTGCEILTKAGKGIWLSYDSQGKKYLDSLLLGGCLLYTSPSPRD